MTIVAAVDSTERAGPILEEATFLASKLDLDLHVVHVKSYEDIKMEPDELGDDSTIKEQTQAEAKNLALEFTDDFHAVGLIGRPKEEIISYARNQNARYIVLSGRKRSPAGKAVFGSTSQYVILNARCPVISVPRRS